MSIPNYDWPPLRQVQHALVQGIDLNAEFGFQTDSAAQEVNPPKIVNAEYFPSKRIDFKGRLFRFEAISLKQPSFRPILPLAANASRFGERSKTFVL